MAETQITRIRSSKTRARSKKKINRERVVFDSLDSSVAKTDVAASTTDEVKGEEPTFWVMEGVPLAVQGEVPMEVTVESLEEGQRLLVQVLHL